MKTSEIKNRRKRSRQRGYTLLEYCAGAAVIMVTVWFAMNTMGTSVAGLLNSIASWANARSGEIAGAQGQGSGGSGGSGGSN